MNTDTGQFVTGDEMKPGMNRYTTGEMVEMANGDRFMVVSFDNVDRDGEMRGEMILRALKLSETEAAKSVEKSLSEFLNRNDDGTVANRKQRRARKHRLDKATRKIQKRDQGRSRK